VSACPAVTIEPAAGDAVAEAVLASSALPYHDPRWWQVLTDTWPRLTIEPYAIVSGGERQGFIPLMSLAVKGFRMVGSPLRGFYTPYLGPVYTTQQGLPLVQLWEALRASLRADILQLSLPPNGDAGALLAEDCKRTAVVDARCAPTELWNSLKESTRRQVRKATREGVVTAWTSPDEETIAAYHALVVRTFARQGLPPPAPRAFYTNLYAGLGEAGGARFLAAYGEDRLIAAGIYLLGEDTIFGVDGAFDRECASLRASSLIEWETIMWAHERGCRYDMVGAEIEGIAAFKRSFGAEVVGYLSRSRCITLKGRLGLSVYQLIKHVFCTGGWKSMLAGSADSGR